MFTPRLPACDLTCVPGCVCAFTLPQAFDDLKEQSLLSSFAYNPLIHAHAHANNLDRAVQLLDEMYASGVAITLPEYPYLQIFLACLRHNNATVAQQLHATMQAREVGGRCLSAWFKLWAPGYYCARSCPCVYCCILVHVCSPVYAYLCTYALVSLCLMEKCKRTRVFVFVV